jgi:hypothetical protein
LAENGHIFVNIEIKEKSGMVSLILSIKFRYCEKATKFEKILPPSFEIT